MSMYMYMNMKVDVGVDISVNMNMENFNVYMHMYMYIWIHNLRPQITFFDFVSGFDIKGRVRRKKDTIYLDVDQ